MSLAAAWAAWRGPRSRSRLKVAIHWERAIERIGRGIYRRTDAESADLDLVEIAIKAPQARLCLTYALAQHDLTDTIPSSIDIALPRGEWQPVTSAPVTWHKFATATFDIGRTTHRIDSEHEIGPYDAPRTIVDCFRLRHILGDDVAYEALRRWLRQRGQSSERWRWRGSSPRRSRRCSTPYRFLGEPSGKASVAGRA